VGSAGDGNRHGGLGAGCLMKGFDDLATDGQWWWCLANAG